MKVIYGILGFVMIFMANALEGGNAESFRHDNVFLLIFGPTFLLSLMHHSERELGGALKASFGSGPLSRAEAARHAAVLSTPRRIVIGLGFVGFGFGLVQVLKHLDDPSKLGAGVAFAFMATLYALILSEFLFAPLVNRIWSRVEDEDPQDEDSSTPPSKDRPRGAPLIFGVLGLGFLALCATFEGIHLPDYIQSTAFIIVVGPAIFLTLAHHSAANTADALRAAFTSEPIPSNKASQHLSVLSTARIITLAAGAIALIFGLVHVLQNLADPNKLGAGLAVATVSPLYALFLSELILSPLSNRIQVRTGATHGTLDTPAKPSAGLLLLGTMGCFSFVPWVLFAVAA